MFLIGIAVVVFAIISSLKPTISKLPKEITSVKLSSIEIGVLNELNIVLGDIIIFKPNKKQIDELISINDLVNGPEFTLHNIPKIFIYRPYSVGCRLSNIVKGDDVMSRAKIDWPGGWIDHCRPGAWDYAGRVVTGINSPSDYEVKSLISFPYKIENDEIIFYPITIE